MSDHVGERKGDGALQCCALHLCRLSDASEGHKLHTSTRCLCSRRLQ